MSLTAALQDFRGTAHVLRVEIRPLTVTIEGTTYAGAGRLQQIAPRPTETGVDVMQEITIRISKEAMPAPPLAGGALEYEGARFVISSIGGQDAGAVAWVVTAGRVV